MANFYTVISFLVKKYIKVLLFYLNIKELFLYALININTLKNVNTFIIYQ